VRALVPLIALLALAGACSKPHSSSESPKEDAAAKEPAANPSHISGTGTVIYSDLEGGFFAIHSDDGVTYDPQSLPNEFKADSVRVKFTVRVIPDAVGIHQVGPIVEVVEMSRLE
jgi:hypothetical protein